MLPGFRLLAIIVVFSASTLVFSLGAAALLRATHEELAGAPLKNLQVPPSNLITETPTLALLQVEPIIGREAQPAPQPEVLPTPETPPAARAALPVPEAKAPVVGTQQTEPQTRTEQTAAQNTATAARLDGESGPGGESTIPLVVLSDPPSPALTEAAPEAAAAIIPIPDSRPHAAKRETAARHRPRTRHRAHRHHRRIVRQRPAPPPPPPQPSFFPLFDPPFATTASTVVTTTMPPPR